MDEVLRRLVVQIGYEVDQGSRDKVDQDQTNTQAKAVAIGQLAAQGIAKAAELGVALVRGLVDAVQDAVQGFADMGSELADTSAKLGVGTDELQRLRYAAKQTGVDIETVGGSLKKLQIGLVEARGKGTGPFVEGLGAIGVRLGELEGLDTEATLGLLGDALRQIEDPAERTAAAVKLFGKSGADMLPLLMQGAGGIGELTAEAERLGLVLDSAAIAKADELGDTLDKVDAQIKIAGARIGGYLAPIVTDAAEGFSQWAADNRGFIEQDLPAVIRGIVEAGGTMLAWLADVIAETRNFAREVGFLVDDAVELATTLRDDLQPAIDAVASVVDAWADAFVGLNTTIGEGIAQVLDYIGVLDTLKAAWDALPFTGESIDDLTARLHGGGASDFYSRTFGGKSGPAPGAGRAAVGAAADAVTETMAAIQGAIAEAGKGGRTSDSRAAARAKYQAGLRKPGKGGGASSGPSGSDTLDRLWGGLTGEGSSESWLDQLGGAIGLGAAPSAGGGGGSSPLAGASFSRVDASFSSTTSITIQVPETVAELGAAYLGRHIADTVADVVETRNQQARDHLTAVARRL